MKFFVYFIPFLLHEKFTWAFSSQSLQIFHSTLYSKNLDVTENDNRINEECEYKNEEYDKHVEIVEKGLNNIYPPFELEERNSLSRKDGYWKYINRGENPPEFATYGEFDIPFFYKLLELSATHFMFEDDQGKFQGIEHWKGKTFCDFGSGTGRLVMMLEFQIYI